MSILYAIVLRCLGLMENGTSLSYTIVTVFKRVWMPVRHGHNGRLAICSCLTMWLPKSVHALKKPWRVSADFLPQQMANSLGVPRSVFYFNTRLSSRFQKSDDKSCTANLLRSRSWELLSLNDLILIYRILNPCDDLTMYLHYPGSKTWVFDYHQSCLESRQQRSVKGSS